MVHKLEIRKPSDAMALSVGCWVSWLACRVFSNEHCNTLGGKLLNIHCGGIDHVSVHHTNEIAQSEAATNKEWVKYWVHGEFLINETGKNV